MPNGRIINLATKSQEINANEMPAALIYFGERAPVRDWQELFFVAVKCLYLEFPDTISSLCSTDPKRTLFLRTNTIDMKRPQRIASIIYLETERTPTQILKAIRFIFNRAGVSRINMQVEVYEAPSVEEFYREEISVQPPPQTFTPPRRPRTQKPVLHLNQSIEEMLAALDAMEVYAPPKKSLGLPPNHREPQIFGQLFFTLDGTRYGPFDSEKNRYVALMQRLAELYPYEILREAGHHINSLHRLTLMKGGSYLYFREPVELPNNLFLDVDFPDRVLVENERYFLERCGLYFETVMLGNRI